MRGIGLGLEQCRQLKLAEWGKQMHARTKTFTDLVVVPQEKGKESEPESGLKRRVLAYNEKLFPPSPKRRVPRRRAPRMSQRMQRFPAQPPTNLCALMRDSYTRNLGTCI